MPTRTNYLDPQTLASVGSLQLRARLVMEGLMAGMHRSPYHGVSVEFAQHRQYTPGDDIRRLDWKVFGRSDKLYLKQYQKETNLDLVLLVDASGSMAYGSDEVAGSRWRKFDCASTLASVLAYLAVNQQDRAGLMLFDDALRGTIRPTNARRQCRAIIDVLAQHELSLGDNELTEAQARGSRAAMFTGRGTDLGRLFDQIGARLTHRSLIVLISDVFDAVESFERGLARLSHRRQDVVVVQKMDHAEIMECYDMLGKESRLRREIKSANNRRSLHKGSIVEWIGNKSGSCTGEVIKVKRKKAIVKQTSPTNSRYHGTNWDIPMSMLTVVG